MSKFHILKSLHQGCKMKECKYLNEDDEYEHDKRFYLPTITEKTHGKSEILSKSGVSTDTTGITGISGITEPTIKTITINNIGNRHDLLKSLSLEIPITNDIIHENDLLMCYCSTCWICEKKLSVRMMYGEYVRLVNKIVRDGTYSYHSKICDTHCEICNFHDGLISSISNIETIKSFYKCSQYVSIFLKSQLNEMFERIYLKVKSSMIYTDHYDFDYDEGEGVSESKGFDEGEGVSESKGFDEGEGVGESKGIDEDENIWRVSEILGSNIFVKAKSNKFPNGFWIELDVKANSKYNIPQEFTLKWKTGGLVTKNFSSENQLFTYLETIYILTLKKLC